LPLPSGRSRYGGGYLRRGAPGDVAAAVDRAAAAQPAWAALGAQERAGYLLRAADAIEANAEELTEVITISPGSH